MSLIFLTILPAYLYLLTGAVSPFIFKVIIDQ